MISVGDLLRQELTGWASQLRDQEHRVREDEDEAAHQLRIAVRRLRSALATYRPQLARQPTDELREELRWLGSQLSPARDAQVVGARLEELAGNEPVELLMGPVRNRIRTEMAARRRAGRECALCALDSERYAVLLVGLDGFAAAPPFTDGPDAAATDVLPRLLSRDLERVRRRAAAVTAAAPGEQRDLALHQTRKGAKRLRYSAEAAEPVLGRRSRRLAKRAQRLQDLLGEHQDTVVARQVLRELGVAAHLARENGFAFGRMHALEQARAERLLARWPIALERLTAKPLRR